MDTHTVIINNVIFNAFEELFCVSHFFLVYTLSLNLLCLFLTAAEDVSYIAQNAFQQQPEKGCRLDAFVLGVSPAVREGDSDGWCVRRAREHISTVSKKWEFWPSLRSHVLWLHCIIIVC